MPEQAPPDQDSIVSEIEIAAPPDRVFRALTDPKQQMVWWGAEPSCELRSFEMDARPGGRWGFQASDRTGHAVNGVTEFEAHGEVLEVTPPIRLKYTWIANWHHDKSRVTEVLWELFPTPAGTRVKVTHSGLAQEAVARKDYAGGWPGVLQLLRNFFTQ